MAASAILDLLFLSILVTRCTSGSSRRHYGKISLIYVNQRLNYYCLCKNPRWRPPPSWILFLFNIFACNVCRTSNVIHLTNFMQICAIVYELWAIDEILNGGHRHLEFIIFVHFGQMVYFSVTAVYISAKFRSSTSIGGWVIAVCAKIQDGGRRHLGFYFCSIFWHACM